MRHAPVIKPLTGRMSRGAEVGVGLIGLGRIGKLHAKHLTGCVPGARLAHVADVRADEARRVGQTFDAPWSISAADVFTNQRVQAVVIATPTETHAALIEQAALAHKHIFCEKPLATSVATTAECVAAAARHGVLLQVGFHLRYAEEFAEVHRAIKAGDLGKPFVFQARLRDMCPPPQEYLRACGGLLLDGGVHLIDLARWLLGDVEEIAATGAPMAETAAPRDLDTAVMILRFASGAVGVAENCRRGGYGFDCSVEVIGSGAAARVGARLGAIEWLSAENTRRSNPVDFLERFSAAYLAELIAFVDAVRLETLPDVTGDDALAAAAIVAAAEEALRGRVFVNVRPFGSRRTLCQDEADRVAGRYPPRSGDPRNPSRG
jgi:predicted dehydrogenase